MNKIQTVLNTSRVPNVIGLRLMQAFSITVDIFWPTLMKELNLLHKMLNHKIKYKWIKKHKGM